MPTSKSFQLTVPRAIVISGVMVSVAILYSGSATATAVATVAGAIAAICAVILTYFSVRSARRIEWFTGSMERHSDQQRQLAAKRAGVDLIWWDPTEDDARHGSLSVGNTAKNSK